MPRPNATAETDGWVRFASLSLIIVGAISIIDGLVAFLDDGYFVVRKSALLVVGSYSAWGSAHLVLGVVLVIVGLAIGAGKTWGRMIALVVVVLNIFVQIAFLPAAPLWSVVIMAFDVTIIYAIVIRFQESKALLG